MPRSTIRTHIGLTLIAVAAVVVLVLVFSPISPFSSRTSRGGGILGLIADTADAIQQWCGKQLLAIANEHLGPQLKFERIDYVPPATIVLSHVTLDAGDERLLAAETIRVSLAETPKKGKPIVIESVDLVSPEFRIVQSEAGHIAGFDGLVKTGGGKTTDDGGSTRLSDVFAIRNIKIENASVSYIRPGQPVMRLDGLNADLATTPAQDQKGSWYTIACAVGRAPLITLAIDGTFDLDSFTLALKEFELSAELSPSQYEMLPPSFQVLLSEYHVRGKLHALGKGTVLLNDFDSSELNVDCTLTDTRLVMGEYQVPIRQGSIKSELRNETITIASATFDAFDGTIEMHGSLGLTGAQPFAASVSATHARIEQLMTGSQDTAERPKGILAGTCRATGELVQTDPAKRLQGEGQLEITEAQLAKVPVVDGLLKTMKKLAARSAPSDRGSATFELQPMFMRLTTFDFVSQSVAARGEGDVHYDGTLDLKMNAGPLERIQGALGAVGELFGKVTDKLVSYRITGTVAAPKYAVEPLGITLKVPFIGKKAEDKGSDAGKPK